MEAPSVRQFHEIDVRDNRDDDSFTKRGEGRDPKAGNLKNSSGSQLHDSLFKVLLTRSTFRGRAWGVYTRGRNFRQFHDLKVGEFPRTSGGHESSERVAQDAEKWPK